MSLTDQLWERLANHARSSVNSLFDPAKVFAEDENLEADSEMPHKGLYIGVTGADGDELSRQGFLEDGATNVKRSVDIVARSLHTDLKSKDVTASKVQTSTFHFSVVNGVHFLPDSLSWDEKKDGVYFMWGQDYRGLYLPYQIRKMNMHKHDIMNKLCCQEVGLCANLWRLPEGLIFRLSCSSYSA